MDWRMDRQTEGRTVRLLYASKSSFGGIENSFVKKIELVISANPVCIYIYIVRLSVIFDNYSTVDFVMVALEMMKN